MISWPDPDLPPINLWNAPHQEEKILSPCVRQCRLEDDVCTGCGRTLDEIQNWRWLTHEQRQAVMDRLGGESE